MGRISLFILAVLLLASCSSGNTACISIASSKSASYAPFEVSYEPSPLLHSNSDVLNTSIEEDEDSYNLILSYSATLQTNGLSVNVNYDPICYSPDVCTVVDPRASSEDTISGTYTYEPGVVNLFMFSKGLSNFQIHQDSIFATIRFIKTPFATTRVASSWPYGNEHSWRLRSVPEFANYDVPFSIEQDGRWLR